MEIDAVLRAYGRLAPMYDVLFGKSLQHGRKRAVEVVNARAGRVLEWGVGTGISLAHYRPDQEVVGIDISPKMLARAKAKCTERNLRHVKELAMMDASNLIFPDGFFDTVVAMYVMSVVPKPEHVLKEIERVCAPGGRVIILNHFAKKDDGLRGAVERRINPISNVVGWKTDFYLDTVLSRTSMTLTAVQTVGLFGLYTLLLFKR